MALNPCNIQKAPQKKLFLILLIIIINYFELKMIFLRRLKPHRLSVLTPLPILTEPEIERRIYQIVKLTILNEKLKVTFLSDLRLKTKKLVIVSLQFLCRSK